MNARIYRFPSGERIDLHPVPSEPSPQERSALYADLVADEYRTRRAELRRALGLRAVNNNEEKRDD
jgi:hypothetical protein